MCNVLYLKKLGKQHETEKVFLWCGRTACSTKEKRRAIPYRKSEGRFSCSSLEFLGEPGQVLPAPVKLRTATELFILVLSSSQVLL